MKTVEHLDIGVILRKVSKKQHLDIFTNWENEHENSSISLFLSYLTTILPF